MTGLPEGIGDWADLSFFRKQWPGIVEKLAGERRAILPPEGDRFAALVRTQPDDTRVVILGQDPYPTPGHANGLAFSVAPGVKLPKSLENIYRELEADLGKRPENGDLTAWADQGILLLNTALSVPAGDAGGHANLGWNALAFDVIKRLSDRPRAFLFWGRPAQALGATAVEGDGHLIVQTPHPSPLSAYRGFFGSRPFSRVNAWLEERGETPVKWA